MVERSFYIVKIVFLKMIKKTKVPLLMSVFLFNNS